MASGSVKFDQTIGLYNYFGSICSDIYEGRDKAKDSHFKYEHKGFC